MVRKIIQINENKCNGCGACASACHEGAIAMVGGKAKLMRDDYCDGLGDCLPSCPVGAITFVEREAAAYDAKAVEANQKKRRADEPHTTLSNRLSQWPVQIKLLPEVSPLYQKADLLIAADCTAYAYGDFHRDFIDGHAIAVGCPKLDSVDYSEKLSRILAGNEIRSLTVVRMEVPCCRGLELAVQRALEICGKQIPLRVVVISTSGEQIS